MLSFTVTLVEWKKRTPHTVAKLMAAIANAWRPFQLRGFHAMVSGLRISTRPRARMKIGGALNLVDRRMPRTRARAIVRFQVCFLRQCASINAEPKATRASTPSLQAIEKLAMREGDNA